MADPLVTPVFPHRGIFEPEEQHVLYQSNWFRNVIGLILFIKEEVRGKTLKDIPTVSTPIVQLHSLFVRLETLVGEVPPLTTGSRFGNLSFRTWLDRAREMIIPFLEEFIESSGVFQEGFSTDGHSDFVKSQLESYQSMYSAAAATAAATMKPSPLGGFYPVPRSQPDQAVTQQRTHHACSLAQELAGYLLDSFGSYKRVDYGTGHELAFVSFLSALLGAGLLRLQDMAAAALIVFARYLRLVRMLQRIYWLEPAGSKGVWGLDDYQFLPFLWGASQMVAEPAARADCVPMGPPAPVNKAKHSSAAPAPALAALFEDSALLRSLTSSSFTVAAAPTPSAAPAPASPVALLDALEGQPGLLFADALAFVGTSKTGAYRVHSPLLYSMASVPGWLLAAQGLCRMYAGEVLAKFPVMQHVLFGSLLRLDEGGDPAYLSDKKRIVDAETTIEDTHTNGLPPLEVIQKVFPVPPEATTPGATRYKQ